MFQRVIYQKLYQFCSTVSQTLTQEFGNEKQNQLPCVFSLQKTKLLKSGEASVSMRITVDGQRVENNIRKSILPNLWDQSKERTKGTSKTAIDLNRFIEEARIKIHQIITELQQNGEEITPVVVQQRFYGIGQVRKQGADNPSGHSGTQRGGGETNRQGLCEDYRQTLRVDEALPLRDDKGEIRCSRPAPVGFYRRGNPCLRGLSQNWRKTSARTRLSAI